jgi:hypothetical protein
VVYLLIWTSTALSIFDNEFDIFWGPPSLPSSGYRGFMSGIKWRGREADHSRTRTSTPISLHGVMLSQTLEQLYLSTGESSHGRASDKWKSYSLRN